MYQLEVKRYLVEHLFRPGDGWDITIDIDAMERAKGGKQPPDKAERAGRAENWLRIAGAKIGAHPDLGRVDLVAARSGLTVVVEVEGDSRRQKEQALYSALGQVLLRMRENGDTRYGLAVPDAPLWEGQMKKIPGYVCERLPLTLWLVSKTGVRELKGHRLR